MSKEAGWHLLQAMDACPPVQCQAITIMKKIPKGDCKLAAKEDIY